MIRLRTTVVLLLATVFGMCLLSGAPVRWFYMTMRGGDLLIARIERTKQVTEIWNSLCRYRTKHGQYPRSQTEWAADEPELATLLRAPKWSGRAAYVVNLNRLDPADKPKIGEHALLVEDPGIRWPGEPNATFDEWRVGVTADGHIVSYSLAYPIFAEQLRCPEPAEGGK